MERYIAPLKKQFKSVADPERAERDRKYLRNQFEFYGLSARELRESTKNFFFTYGYPPFNRLSEFSLYLWNLPEREYQHVVVDLLHKFAKKLREADIIWIERLIIEKSWWDTVDGLAA